MGNFKSAAASRRSSNNRKGFMKKRVVNRSKEKLKTSSFLNDDKLFKAKKEVWCYQESWCWRLQTYGCEIIGETVK